MSAINRPNIHIKNTNGKLQESYIVKKQRLDKKRLLESKELVDRVHSDSEEYTCPSLSSKE